MEGGQCGDSQPEGLAEGTTCGGVVTQGQSPAGAVGVVPVRVNGVGESACEKTHVRDQQAWTVEV